MPRKNNRKKSEYRRLQYNTKFSDRDKGYNTYHKKHEKRTDVVTISVAASKASLKRKRPGRSETKRCGGRASVEMNYKPFKYSRNVGNTQPRRGEIWYVDLGEFDFKFVEKGCRPAVIISMDESNERSGTVTILPMTSQIRREWYSTHILIDERDIIPTGAQSFVQSMILVDQIRTVDKVDLVNRAGIVSHSKMLEVEDGIRAWTGV